MRVDQHASHAGDSRTRPRARACAAALLLAFVPAAWGGEAAAPVLSLAAEAMHRRLVERADDGARLLAESGELLRLRGDASMVLRHGGALRASALAAAGTLDYAGQTQAGVPLATGSSHRDLGVGLAWRPVAPAPWGEGWLTLDALQQRRQIASTSTAQGLRETSTLLLAGVRWSRGVEAAGWHWRPAVEWRATVAHRLEIGFGGVFDTAHITGGRRRELVLAFEVAPAGSPWQWALAWSRARQAASGVEVLTRAGAPAASVRQPRLEIDDVMLHVKRSF